MSNGLSVSDITPLGERPADVWRGRTGSSLAGVDTLEGIIVAGPPSASGDFYVYDPATDTWKIVNTSTISGGLAWFNVKKYGAVGDGTTDDTAAINLAIAALVAATKGVLYFPAGSYKTTAALTALSVPCTVLGDGASGWDGSTETASQVDCTSATASLFTVSSPAVKFEGLALLNTAGSTPSAGAGVTVTNGYGFKMVDCSIDGFWIDVDYQVGSIYSFVGTYFINPVKYAVKLRNTSVGDEGDGKFVNCWFYSNSHAADAAIRIESGGGIGITNCYINRLLPSTNYFVRGIDVANATVTSQLSIYGVQIENVSEDGIHIVSNGANTWDLISIVDCGIHLYRSSATTARAISISSDTLGDINTVVIEANNFKATAGSSVAAIGLTKVNNAVIGANLNDSNLPFLGYLSTSGCTAIYDQGGGVAAGVSITGTPSSGQVPVASSGTAAAWAAAPAGASGTSFPLSPTTNDRFFRTDYLMEFVYDGTRWVSTQYAQIVIGQSDTLNGYTTGPGTQRAPVPVWSGSDILLVSTHTWFFVSGGTALDASNKWVGTVVKNPAGTTLDTVNINSGASNAYRQSGDTSIAALLGTTNFELQISWAKTGTPGTLFTQTMITFRYVAV